MSTDALSRAAACQDNTDRLHNDNQIQKEPIIFHVIKVVCQLISSVFERGSVGIVCLSPTGNTRLDAMTLTVKRDRAAELIDKQRSLRPRADKAHIPVQNV